MSDSNLSSSGEKSDSNCVNIIGIVLGVFITIILIVIIFAGCTDGFTNFDFKYKLPNANKVNSLQKLTLAKLYNNPNSDNFLGEMGFGCAYYDAPSSEEPGSSEEPESSEEPDPVISNLGSGPLLGLFHIMKQELDTPRGIYISEEEDLSFFNKKLNLSPIG
jgi:hypothetical protein